MAARDDTGLGDVINIAFQSRGRVDRSRETVFGAAGARGGFPDQRMLSLLREAGTLDGRSAEAAGFRSDPFARMFATNTGQRAVAAVGNEALTLAAFDALSAEITASALEVTGVAKPQDRILVKPGQLGRPPLVILMSPDVHSVSESSLISDEVDLPFEAIQKVSYEAADPEQRTPAALVFRQLLEAGPASLAELFFITRPEVIRTRRPRMIPLCVPSPHLRIEANGKLSTAGILCRDEDGELGVTGCLHGTGPVGSAVLVDLRSSYVKRSDAVQDIVFIPLGAGFNRPQLQGLAGVLSTRQPGVSDLVRFDGATNQNRITRILSADKGLLRTQPAVQLRVQTDPDTDPGDSGSALLDDQDRVIGFAFQRTGYDDHPQFTDWIWAANALRALKLTPV